MKQQIQVFLQSILSKMGSEGFDCEVTISENSQHGDYTSNLALRAAKTLKKSPMDIALQVAENINTQIASFKANKQDHNISKDNQKTAAKIAGNAVLQDIERAEAVSPGFINLFVSEAKLSSQVGEVIKRGKSYGTTKSDVPERVTIEFTDPNPFKEFHIGHLYSNTVGESLSRIIESQGHLVRRVNYQGDAGMHVAKSIWGLLSEGKKDVLASLARLEKLPISERIHALGKAYAKGAAAFEENESAKEEMKRLNKLIFIAAQRMWKREKGLKPIVDYQAGEKIDEGELAQVSKIYEMGRTWSLEYFELLYKRLGTSFDGYYFESAVGERGVDIVRKHLKDGVFEESEGAIVYRGEKKGLHTRVFVNQLGLPTYEAKELGLAPTKHEDWPYDRSIIITGNEINEYFKVLLSALSEIAPDLAAKTQHMGHGMVRNADGSKMSSRSGQVLTGEGLLEEVKTSIYTIVDTNRDNYTKKDREEVAEKAAVAATKYSLLRVSLPSDVAFDLATSVSFDGDSGPYLLYTYARAQSVVRKAGKNKPSAAPKGELNPEERAVARLLLYFPDVVAQAAANLAPSDLCTYLFSLAGAFNLFYQKHPILEEGKGKGMPQGVSAFRLGLTAATAQVLANGLHLLGIATVERM
jgi:arginyl-tRNA synthetase